VSIEFGYADDVGCARDMDDEQRQKHEALREETAAAWEVVEDASGYLVNTNAGTEDAV
jgi:hypothetical protein